MTSTKTRYGTRTAAKTVKPSVGEADEAMVVPTVGGGMSDVDDNDGDDISDEPDDRLVDDAAAEVEDDSVDVDTVTEESEEPEEEDVDPTLMARVLTGELRTVAVPDQWGNGVAEPEQVLEPMLKAIPQFEDAVDGMHYCNQELSELLLQLLSSNRSRAERLIRSLLGDDTGNQWLAGAKQLIEHRDKLSKQIVQQIMRSSMGIR